MATRVLLLCQVVVAKLLLSEDFSCASIGCNGTDQPTERGYRRWRWSTTGSAQAYLHVKNATGRAGNEIDFSVEYCLPPKPNPDKLGCYRSEFALQRNIQASLVDWTFGIGSSERWLGFSNKLPGNFSWDTAAPQTGPCLQMHGGAGLPSLKGLHPVLNLQVDMTGCAPTNKTCPRWQLLVQSVPVGDYGNTFDLGPATFGNWEDWVIQIRFSPSASRGYLSVWRNSLVVLPKTNLATAYNDTVPPYLKFGVYRGDWKEDDGRTRTALWSGISYGAMKVGDETSSFAEVSTAQS